MNADGSNQTQLTNSGYSPRWSPDSSRITFLSNRDGNFEIYVMNADGSNQTRLTNNPDLDESPDWSPDGTRMVFKSLRDLNNNSNIYVMNADGTSQTRLTNYTEVSKPTILCKAQALVPVKPVHLEGQQMLRNRLTESFVLRTLKSTAQRQ
jgi:Tol biopolymer transport system component